MLRIILLLAIMLTITSGVFAQTPVPTWDTMIRIKELKEDPRTHFRSESSLALPESPVPVVVDIPLDEPRQNERMWNSEIMVLNSEGIIVPSYVKQMNVYAPTSFGVTSSIGDGMLLGDGNTGTGVTFPLPIDTRLGIAKLDITPSRPFTVSGMSFFFEQNAIPPVTIEIRSRDAYGNETIVLSRTSLKGTSVQFMPTYTQSLSVYLEYNQPVRIHELTFSETSGTTVTKWSARFLMQPGITYTLFSDPDTHVNLPYQNVSNLTGDTGYLRGERALTTANTHFIPVDADRDGISDITDNCPNIANPLQEDINGNAIGDLCDDYDRDGYINSSDNCPDVANYQRDEDGDGIGDECDTEESRFTERLPWVPWVGMGIAGLVLLGLFVFVALETRKQKPTVS